MAGQHDQHLLRRADTHIYYVATVQRAVGSLRDPLVLEYSGASNVVCMTTVLSTREIAALHWSLGCLSESRK